MDSSSLISLLSDTLLKGSSLLSTKFDDPLLTTPVKGLTSFQSKVIGPQLTAAPTHRHPPQGCSIGRLAPLTFSLRLPPDLADDESLRGLGFECLSPSISGVDVPDGELLRAQLASADDEIGEALASPFKCRVLSDILQALSSDIFDNPSSAEFMTRIPAVVPRTTLIGGAFGFPLERACSVALTGRPCRFNIINAEVLRVMTGVSRTRLVELFTAAGVMPRLVSIDTALDTVARGAAPGKEVSRVLLLVISHVLQRAIVSRATRTTAEATLEVYLPTLSADFPKAGDEFERELPPVTRHPLFFVDGAPLIAAVPTAGCERHSVGDDSSVPWVADVPACAAVFPPIAETERLGAVLGRFCTLYSAGRDENDVEAEEEENDGSSKICFIPADGVGIVVLDSDDGAVLPDLCGRYQEWDEASGNEVLSFASFPPCAFTLASSEEEAKMLLDTPGHRKDQSGAADYQALTLQQFDNVALIDVAGDGHCLLHSVSCALTGADYYWHALRAAVHRFMAKHGQKLLDALSANTAMCSDKVEMDILTERARPDFTGEPGQVISIARGLGCEHVFALCNVLRRPILLLDALDAPLKEAYVFLPLLFEPAEVVASRFLALVWANTAHTHFVPLVRRVRSSPASFPATALPRSVDGEILVYALPDGAQPLEVLSRYLARGIDPVCTPTTFEIGGEDELDPNVWCNGVVQKFEQAVMGGVSIWGLHEYSRLVAQRTGATDAASQQLACVGNVDEELSEIIEQLCIQKIGICPQCATTRDARQITCCYAPLRPFDLRRGVFLWKEGDRCPLKSCAPCNCCAFKHWTSREPLTPGAQVYGRNYCSALAPATVLAVDVSNCECDVAFRDGTVRFSTPLSDISDGSFVDWKPRLVEIRSPSGAEAPYIARVFVDSDRDLTANAARLARHLVLERVKMDLGAFALHQDAQVDAQAAMQRELQRAIDLCVQAADRRRSSNPLLNAPLNDFTPVLQDEAGNSIRWQWYDSVEYCNYEPDEVSGKIEAAFVAGDPSTVVQLGGRRYNIDFVNMVQVSELKMRRAIRRVLLKPWACEQCTLKNEALILYCVACAATRPLRCLVELDSFEQKEERDNARRQKRLERKQTKSGDLDGGGATVEEVEDAAALERLAVRDRQIEDRTAVDTDLRSGNYLYNAAMSSVFGCRDRIIPHPQDFSERLRRSLREKAVHFPAVYGSRKFVYFEPENVFIPVPTVIPRSHRLHILISTEGRADVIDLQGGEVLVTRWRTLTLMKNAADSFVVLRSETFIALGF